MHRYRIDSMKYDHRVNLNNRGGASSEMNDWGKAYPPTSPPSSRYGEDDTSSVTNSRPRRSRLHNDISQPRGPIIIQPARPDPRKSHKHGNGSMNNGGMRTHNSTFNGYDNNYPRAQYNSSRGANESFSGLYPPSRNASGYASDYLNNRSGVGMLPNKMREPRRPRSTAADKYPETVANNGHNGFGGYESGELSTSEDGKQNGRRDSDDISEDERDVDEEMKNYYMQARRAHGSRSVTNTMPVETFDGEDEKYYYGVVQLGSNMVEHVFQTMPPPDDFYKLKPIERVAYIFYSAVYKKPYQNVTEFHKIFNREFFKHVCSGDTNDLALFKICKSMQTRYTMKQVEESKRKYEKLQKEAAESEKLDFNQHRLADPEDHKVAISEPEEVLSHGPLHYHSCLQFATIGVGGKLIVVRPAGTIDASGHVLSSTNVQIDDLKSLLHADEQSSKVIESVQSFKGPLIPGLTPTHSVRLYIQRQIDSLRLVKNSEDVKKSEVVDALLIWQLLEIMVQQHGRVTGPDVATLLTNASEELHEKTGIAESASNGNGHKTEAKERFNKFLLGGHINEAVESAITDGLYADAMTLIRRLHPNDAKKIEEIETRFMNLRSVDDPFATLVSVASDQPPPILTNSAFDDDNNWKRHAAIVLANLSSVTAMQTIYNLGLMLARRERHCAADFCLLVVCILANYDPFMPLKHIEGEEKSRKHIGLVHSGSHLLNRVDGLSGTAGFSFTDLHATDIFDYALRLGNNNTDSPLAKSVDYQLARIAYAKKLSSYGGFATDAFRYCTEVARSLWMYTSNFESHALFDLCDLAESLHYVAAATASEMEWIGTLRMMLSGVVPPAPAQDEQTVRADPEERTITSEAQKWHDDHQAPLEIRNVVPTPPTVPPETRPQEVYQSPVPIAAPHQPVISTHARVTESNSLQTPNGNLSETITTSTVTDSTENVGTAATSASRVSSIAEPLPPPLPKIVEQPMPTPQPPVFKKVTPEIPMPSEYSPPAVTPPPMLPTMPLPSTPQPIPIAKPIAADIVKSPRTELEDLWGAAPPRISQPAPVPPVPTMKPNAPTSAPTFQQAPPITQPSVPNTKTAPPPATEKPSELSKNDRKTSKGWFGSIKEKVIKSIPSANQMILPDDKKPSIVWDPVKQKYVGSGVEEEVVAPPPPVMSAPHLTGGGADSNKSSTNSLRNARSGVGSRYLQSGMATSQAPAMNTGMPSMMPPTMMPLPTTFGFMPAAAEDDSSEYVDPFSAQGNPSGPSDSGVPTSNDQ